MLKDKIKNFYEEHETGIKVIGGTLAAGAILFGGYKFGEFMSIPWDRKSRSIIKMGLNNVPKRNRYTVATVPLSSTVANLGELTEKLTELGIPETTNILRVIAIGDSFER